MLSPGLSLRLLHSTTACTARWGFVIAILPSWFRRHHPGHQAVRSCGRVTSRPGRMACTHHHIVGCQPSFHFSAAGLFHPARLDRPLCFAPALLISLACTCIACTRMHAPPTHCSSCARMLLSRPLLQEPTTSLINLMIAGTIYTHFFPTVRRPPGKRHFVFIPVLVPAG